MKVQRIAIAVTVVNAVLLVITLTQFRRASTEPVASVVRARTFELVDERGQSRSKLAVMPDGEVLLRMLDSNGTIRVKLGAGVDGSGLLLADETAEPGISMIARRSPTTDRPRTTEIQLVGESGEPHYVRP